MALLAYGEVDIREWGYEEGGRVAGGMYEAAGAVALEVLEQVECVWEGEVAGEGMCGDSAGWWTDEVAWKVRIEDFLMQPGAHVDRLLLSPVAVTTAMLVELEKWDLGRGWWSGDVDLQSRSIKSGARGKDEFLRRRGLWVVGEEHARDAIRHAVSAL
ncbi:MAG: hypothetical protein E6R03_12710 [Hyphomicrobiaceae bacterium]|nr:MAG: hypothetical protein E6R03_12710 [Hyphomicrobiaceae bacterium]